LRRDLFFTEIPRDGLRVPSLGRSVGPAPLGPHADDITPLQLAVDGLGGELGGIGAIGVEDEPAGGAIAAAEQGKGWEYLDQVSRMMWNGGVKNWTEGTHLRDAINRAGLDGDKMIAEAKKNPKKYDDQVNANQKLQDAANHGGVPLFVVRGEPFFGQDRIDQLMWRLGQYGVKLKPGAEPVKANGPNTCKK